MYYGIFNPRTDVTACNCTKRCTDTVGESAVKVEKIPCRTGQSKLRRRRAGPMLYQLSYIPPTGFSTEYLGLEDGCLRFHCCFVVVV